MQLATAITANGQQADTFIFCQIAILPQLQQYFVDKAGAGFDQRINWLAVKGAGLKFLKLSEVLFIGIQGVPLGQGAVKT